LCSVSGSLRGAVEKLERKEKSGLITFA